MKIKECIYEKYYGGKWWKFLCCHIWKHLVTQQVGCLTIQKYICVDCGKYEIIILIDWQGEIGER